MRKPGKHLNANSLNQAFVVKYVTPEYSADRHKVNSENMREKMIPYDETKMNFSG